MSEELTRVSQYGITLHDPFRACGLTGPTRPAA